jgi:F0F1-type ATP synthase membrane subunit b/b'
MQDFSRKVEEAVRQVEERIHEAAPHLNQKVSEASVRLEKEAQEMITYLNDEVIPAIRTHSTKALRVASDKLTHLAAYIESHNRS